MDALAVGEEREVRLAVARQCNKGDVMTANGVDIAALR